ncbi:hypothetical protein ACN27F_34385 [Solwaraspora sp. WMMB335]|uniref:hypothetical protein n=1 Tax=Solwaraspora sp. WMMB335 TaxID=3404118 RepID=UPI003B92FCFB
MTAVATENASVPAGVGRHRRAPAGWLRRFPVTIGLTVQYVPFAVVPAVLSGNPHRWFVIQLTGLAVLAAFGVEVALARLHRPGPQWVARLTGPVGRDRRLARGARLVAAVALGTNLLGTLVGMNSYRVAIDAVSRSTVEPLLTPFRAWPLIAVVLISCAWRAGVLPVRAALGWLAALAASVLLNVTVAGMFAPAFEFFTGAAACLLLLGLVRVRTVLAVVLAGLLLWPMAITVRNEVRMAAGAVQYRDYDAYGRLRLDTLIGSAAGHPVPIDVGQPDLLTMARYAVLPRMLDRDRPQVSTGRLLDTFRGGSGQSSYTFLSVGNLWLLTGPAGMMLFFAVVAAYLGLLLATRSGPFKLAAAVLVIEDLVLVGMMYPDSIAGHLQALVALGAAYLVVRLAGGARRADRGSPTDRGRRTASVGPGDSTTDVRPI